MNRSECRIQLDDERGYDVVRVWVSSKGTSVGIEVDETNNPDQAGFTLVSPAEARLIAAALIRAADEIESAQKVGGE